LVAYIHADRLERERCIIYHMPELEAVVEALRWTLVAYVSGGRRSMGCEAVQAAILKMFPRLDGHLTAHCF
jgi:hypothetical protein